MATSRTFAVALALASAPAWPHEASNPLQCQTAASAPAIADARAQANREPNDLRASFALADAWSDAGCFSDAVDVLQSATANHPESAELQTRLRVAKSLVGEERFFEDLDRADMQARLKRAAFRCSSLSDLDACAEALRLKPDDPVLLISQGDALMRAKHAADALDRYRRAAALTPDLQDIGEKIKLAESELPVSPSDAASAARQPRAPSAANNSTLRRYSNVEPDAQTH
jgi:predicted Zn-dependent protease